MQQSRSSRLLSLLLSFLFCLVSLIPSAPASAAEWTVEDLDALQDAFVARISASYSSIEYPWQFVIDCTAQNCYNSNPDSPYGIPVFPTKAVMARQFSPAAAFVAIMETPPPMRYFGVTPYLFTRTYTRQIGSNPATPGTIPIFMSLADTFNLRTVATAGSPVPGENQFTQLSAFVMTADRVTANEITSALTAIGFPDYAINQVSLPVTAVPLTMGLSATADTFTLLLRVAYPDDPDRLTDYLSRVPMRGVYLTPVVPRPLSPVPTPVYRIPGNGQPEPAELSSALSQLVTGLQNKFSNYSFTSSGKPPFQTTNYVCAQYAIQCKGDNSDAVYKTDVSETYIPSSRQDRIMIAGVNHISTGKATYFSHSIVDPSNASGVQAIGDAWLAGTALAMTGVEPGDERYNTYQQLYAFTMSYDCGDDPLCITIPEGEDGVPFGSPFSVTGRVYLDPATNTRPSLNEIIMSRAFIMKRNGIQQVAVPVILPAGGTFADSVTVSISIATNGASIRYTLDGSDPTESASLYSAPIVLTGSATVKARGFATGYSPSEITSGVFTVMPSSQFDFSMSNGGNKTANFRKIVSNTITTMLVSGSTRPVVFSISGLPTGSKSSFSAGSCSPSCSTTVRITLPRATPAGTYPVAVTGTAGTVVKTTGFNIRVR